MIPAKANFPDQGESFRSKDSRQSQFSSSRGIIPLKRFPPKPIFLIKGNHSTQKIPAKANFPDQGESLHSNDSRQSQFSSSRGIIPLK
jgi:hypothetical protein